MKSHLLVWVLFAMATIACNQTTPPGPSSPLVATVTVNGIDYTLYLQKTIFQLSDLLQLSFDVSNTSPYTREYLFANQQQFGFKLTDTDGTVVLYQPVIVQPAPSTFGLQPNQSRMFRGSYVFVDQNGRAIGRGEYRLSAYLTEGNSPEVILTIEVR